MLRTSGGMAIALELLFLCYYAAASEAPEDGNWTVSHGANDEISVVQCGLDATLLVLDYFHMEYPLVKVSAGLPLSEEGIALADIQQILSGFGLQAAARRNVTVGELTNALDPDVAAIVPLPRRGSHHYFVAVMDNEGRPVIANPPLGVDPLPHGLRESQLAKVGGLVLFVRRAPESMPAMSEQVAVSPRSLELGKFVVTGSTRDPKRPLSFSVTNRSRSAMMLTDVQESCGCMDLNWKGGLLKPGERQVIHFSLFQEALKGTVKKSILLKFGDGSVLPVPIHGRAIPVPEEPRIQLSQESAIADLTEAHTEKSIDVRVTRVKVYGVPMKDLGVAADKDWLTPTIVETDSQSGVLWAKIDVDRAMGILQSTYAKVSGELTISSSRGLEPASVTLEVVWRELFRMEPAFLRITERSQGHTVVAVPQNAKVKIKALEVKSVPAGLETKIFREPGKAGVIVRLATSGVRATVFGAITIAIEAQSGRRETVEVPVHLVSRKR